MAKTWPTARHVGKYLPQTKPFHRHKIRVKHFWAASRVHNTIKHTITSFKLCVKMLQNWSIVCSLWQATGLVNHMVVFVAVFVMGMSYPKCFALHMRKYISGVSTNGSIDARNGNHATPAAATTRLSLGVLSPPHVQFDSGKRIW